MNLCCPFCQCRKYHQVGNITVEKKNGKTVLKSFILYKCKDCDEEFAVPAKKKECKEATAIKKKEK
jgi:hypothetical protein